MKAGHDRHRQKQPQAQPLSSPSPSGHAMVWPAASTPVLRTMTDAPPKFSWPAWPPDDPLIAESVAGVLQSGQWGAYHAEIHRQLHEKLLRRWQADHVQLTCSGTAALELALRVARLPAGSEVLLAAYDFAGIRRTVECLRLRPVLVDLSAGRGQVDLEQLQAARSEQTSAAIVTHLYGATLPMRGLREWADQQQLVLIEDACHVPDVAIDGRAAGTWGHAGILSFGGSKLLTSGNGGALLIQEPRLASRCRALVERPSDAYPLSLLQAAALTPQLERLAERRQQRQRRAVRLSRLLAAWGRQTWVDPEATARSDYYKYAFLARDADERTRLINAAAAVGVPLRAGYEAAGRVARRRYRAVGDLENADSATERVITLDHRVLSTDEGTFTRLEGWLQTQLGC